MSQSRRGRRMMSAVSSPLVLALVAAMPHPAAAAAPPAPSVDPATPLEDLKLLLPPLTEAQLATGVTGTVREMSLVSTTLVTGDSQLIVVPNSNVWGSMITNINASPTRRVDLTFDEVGVSIPFPQRDIHVYTHGKPETQIVSG